MLITVHLNMIGKNAEAVYIANVLLIVTFTFAELFGLFSVESLCLKSRIIIIKVTKIYFSKIHLKT